MKSHAFALWKRLPAAWREWSHRIVQAVSRAAIPLQVARNWRRGRPAAPDAPIQVLGLFRSSIGIGQGARLFHTALARDGFAVEALDAGDWARVPADLPPTEHAPVEPAAVVLSHLNPPELERVLEACHARVLRRKRHIGYWAWELPVAPTRWRRAFRYVDEVWTPSTFSADALRRIAPQGVAVHAVPHPVWAWDAAPPDRAGFGLPDDACVILVALDLKSTAARKNPLGAMEAYRRAKRPDDGALLVCKVAGAQAQPGLYAALETERRKRDDIRLIPDLLSQERMSRLIAGTDIVFSPHRAEGFGLLLAEGMRMGKAVVATGWSGNMDFMDADTAALIDYRLAPVVDPQGMYRDAQWAEPDLDHAAEHLAALIADPAARAALGGRARERGGPVFDPAAWRALVAERLGEGGGGAVVVEAQAPSPSRSPA